MSTTSVPVALLNMPFALLTNPPLGLGLLKAALARRGVNARVLNLNLRFGRQLGTDVYECVAMSQPTMLAGEWAFSSALWGSDAASDEAYLGEVLGYHGDGSRSPAAAAPETSRFNAGLRREIGHVAALAGPFLDACVVEHAELWQNARLVGFTSVFEQHVASLALAKRLKERYPHLFLVIGGSNCEGPMGQATLDGFPFLDAVCSGEGDLVFPELVERVLGGRSTAGLPGILQRQPAAEPSRKLLPTLGAVSREAATNTVHDMDALPYPDFDEYFADVQELDITPRLMFETSRGCWWGAKQHCTFCGLNGATMAFRAKSADRALGELLYLLDRYGKFSRTVSAVDNIIPLQYFRDFLPMLRELELDINLFYETKANLKKEQIALYRDAGLSSIQPGIESLSTPVLRLMRKGITQLQNVQLLKWCAQYGIHPIWNFIIGFPGERAEDYTDQDQLVRAIAHLPCPDGYGRVRFDRFSPYFTSPEEFGLQRLTPYPSYRHVYRGLDERLQHDLAYYFEGDYAGKEHIESYTGKLTRALDDWMRNGSGYALFSSEVGTRLQIFDLRPDARSFVITLEGADRVVYDACDAVTGRGQLSRTLGGEAGLSEREIDGALARLLEHRLLACEGEQYLSLGVPLGYRYAPSHEARRRLVDAMRQSA